MTSIAVFGDPVLDQIYSISDPIRTGGKMLGAFVTSVPGGTTANFACAASNFGLNTTFFGRVADNQEGVRHKNGLEAFNVATNGLQAVATERGAHTILAIDSDGEKTLIYVPLDGPDPMKATVAPDNCDLAYVMAADFNRLSELPTGIEVCVDVDAAAGLSMDAFKAVRDQTDVLFINDVGCQKLTGQAPNMDRVIDLMGPRISLICCTGGAGTTYVAERLSGQLKTVESAALSAKVIDTTGAGDCFNAAFLSERARGCALEDVLRFAMAAGALATETLGARDAIPTREAVATRAEI